MPEGFRAHTRYRNQDLRTQEPDEREGPEQPPPGPAAEGTPRPGTPGAVQKGGAAKPGTSTHVVIVDKRSDFRWPEDGLSIITAKEYITSPDAVRPRNARVINLSRNAYEYLGIGYYCSLLAEAREHRVIPSVKTILDLSLKTLYRPALPELEELLRKRIRRMANPPETSFHLYVFFGTAEDRRFQDVARRTFDLFRAPLLKLSIRWKEDWIIHAVEPLSVDALRPDQIEAVGQAMDAYTRASWRAPKIKAAARYTLAVLHNPKEKIPPSDPRALQKFIKAGEALGIDVELIEKKDYLRLAEYDGLFIRETTALDDHTYRFAKKAEKEGMPVIDDPNSILKCTNKVYLAELLKANKLPAPRTVILDKSRLASLEQEFEYPIVLKIPDGSSSRGVFRVRTPDELQATAAMLFDESDVILAQEYMYTEFDWRVGVLNRQPIFVCQYEMAKKHWQILRHTANGGVEEGGVKTFLVEDAPKEVVQLAVAAAGMIGDGLYGVDLKQNEKGLFVIEINDNPTIDVGVEDQKLKDDLYRIVMREFLRRMDARAGS
ncbi:MAG TPA: RimK family protein [Azospirillaceae bacterium]|nr:RimK family protein [Azospirillaceae bacterium]